MLARGDSCELLYVMPDANTKSGATELITCIDIAPRRGVNKGENNGKEK